MDHSFLEAPAASAQDTQKSDQPAPPPSDALGERPLRAKKTVGRDNAQTSLRMALRRARLENAERSGVLSDLQSATTTRLEILYDRLAHVRAEIPADCDYFDMGIARGDRPRLFIDWIAFVEMARDGKTYRFFQDGRLGRLALAESAGVDEMAQAITLYIARRLIEREKALASVQTDSAALQAAAIRPAPASPQTRQDIASASPAAPSARNDIVVPAAEGSFFSRLFLFVIEVLGSAAFFAALIVGLWWVWGRYTV